MRGPRGTDFEGGVYHGKILLPEDYPFKPPDMIFLTVCLLLLLLPPILSPSTHLPPSKTAVLRSARRSALPSPPTMLRPGSPPGSSPSPSSLAQPLFFFSSTVLTSFIKVRADCRSGPDFLHADSRRRSDCLPGLADV